MKERGAPRCRMKPPSLSLTVRGVRCGAAAMLALGLAAAAAALAAATATATAAAEDSAGRAAYVTHCSACHGANLSGTNFGPPLYGEGFTGKWTAAGPEALRTFIRTSMPPAKPDSLGADTYRKIGEFLLTEGAEQAAAGKAAEGVASKGAAAAKIDLSAYKGPAPNEDAVFQGVIAARQALLDKTGTLDEATLVKPADEDWLHFRRTYDGLGYSPLKQIDKANAHSLAPAWVLSLSAGSNEIEPVIHDGVLYVQSNDRVLAVDAAGGELLWQYLHPMEAGLPITHPRGLAFYRDKIYVSTMDVHFIALNAKTGKVVWEHAAIPDGSKVWMTMAPTVIRGKVIGGTTDCDRPKPAGGCVIIALDAETGQEAWRVRTIAQPGEAGGNTWNDAPAEERTGAGVWGTPTYDPDLNLLFIGTANSYNLPVLLRSSPNRGVNGDALYTDTTLAINPDTGKVVWTFQHFPHDVWNMDWAFERSLITLPISGRDTKVIVSSGKLGIFDVLEAKSGKFLFSIDVGLQNIVSSVDQRTGRKNINPAALPTAGKSVLVCPSTQGVRTWPATAIDPTTRTLFVAASESCMDFLYQPGSAIPIYPVLRPRPNSDGNFGRVEAIDLQTRKVLWVRRERAPHSSAVLATGGGLIFEGSRDRWFRASDSATGEHLWKVQLNAEPSSYPVTYAVAGTQYVAVVAGGGGPTAVSWKTMTPEITDPPGAVTTLWVFKLAR
jgi:alcohol dehydrogenase (cytochrome c)